MEHKKLQIRFRRISVKDRNQWVSAAAAFCPFSLPWQSITLDQCFSAAASFCALSLSRQRFYFVLFYLFIFHFKMVFNICTPPHIIHVLAYIYKITCITKSSIQIYTIYIVTWRSQNTGTRSQNSSITWRSVAPIHTIFFGIVYHLFVNKSRQFLRNSQYALLWQELIPHSLELYQKRRSI